MTSESPTKTVVVHPPARGFFGQLLDFYDRNVSLIQWGIIGVAFLGACGIYWYRTTAASEAAAWSSLSQAGSPEAYAEVASVHAGTQAAQWAKLREANSYLQTGLEGGFTDREKATTDLKKALVVFEELLNGKPPRDVREATLFGYARTLEMTADGDLTKVIAAYETLIAEFPKSVYLKDANDRVRQLKSGDSQQFYAWYSKQNPKPAPPAEPKDSIGGASKPGAQDGSIDPLTLKLPGMENDPVRLPTLTNLPGTDKSEDTPADEKPVTTEQPAEGDKPATEPATDKPAEEKTETEQPATEATPAAEAPATETPATETPATEASPEAPAKPE